MRDVNTGWPGRREVGPRSAPLRANARRSRAQLLAAAGALLAAERPFTLTDVARGAGVSVATAYRHFRNADDVADAFISGFLDDVEDRMNAEPGVSDPCDRLRQINAIWVAAVLDWGQALAHLRSPDGFLARRARADSDVIRSLDHVEPALEAVLGDVPTAEQLSYAVAVWNALGDPREILDQHQVLGWNASEITARLTTTVLAACPAVSRGHQSREQATPRRRPPGKRARPE